MRTCSSCGESKSLDGFYKDRDGRCKGCRLAVKKQQYAKRKAGRLATSPVEAATCPDCGERKPASGFGVDHARPTGIKLYCKPCVAARSRNSKYRLTDTQYAAMVEAQAGCCAVCAQPSKLVVDHDHATGEIRGLLCDPCNVGLGRYDDDPERLMAAAAYLLRQANVLGKVY